jgi:hypothetical protein
MWRFLIFGLIVLSSCKEITARKLAGSYTGTVRTYDQKPNEPIIDYTVPTEFVVTKHKKTIDVLNEILHEDSLSDGYYSRLNDTGDGGVNSVQVKDDSMIVIIYEKYKFGFIRFKEYRGLKEKK